MVVPAAVEVATAIGFAAVPYNVVL